MSAWRYTAVILAASLWCGAPGAQTVLNPDAPQRYTVREGDTLWDISGRFLRDPWRWPQIWQRNPHIDNPDLIYPGDEVLLTYDVSGQPVIRVSRARERFASGVVSPEGRPVVKLTPRARVSQREVPIPTIPIDAIRQFLSRPMVVEADELLDAPYIVSLGTEHLLGGSGQPVYVRGLEQPRETLYTVLRQGDAYVDPDDPDGEVLGYAAVHVAEAALERTGDPATMRLVSARQAVLVGDRMLPSTDEGVLGAFMPHPPQAAVRGKIISVHEGVTQIGRHNVVVLNLGREDGIDQGSVLGVYQRGAELQDPFAVDPNASLPEPDAQIEFDPERQRGMDGLTMTLDRFVRDVHDLLRPADTSYRDYRLPEERAGTLMVFRAFDRLSYALVMEATRAMHVSDVVTNP